MTIPEFPAAQGSNADGMYFIESGVVDVHVIGNDGKTEKLVSILMQQLFSKFFTIHNSSIQDECQIPAKRFWLFHGNRLIKMIPMIPHNNVKGIKAGALYCIFG